MPDQLQTVVSIDFIYKMEPTLKKLTRIYIKHNNERKFSKSRLLLEIELNLKWYVGKDAFKDELKSPECYEMMKEHLLGLCKDIN